MFGRPSTAKWQSGYFFLLTFAASAPAQVPFNFHFTPTQQPPAAIAYDAGHNRFLVTVPDLDQLLSLSATDGTVLAKTWLNSPNGLDISPDGQYVYVGSFAPLVGIGAVQGIYKLDSGSLQVIDFYPLSIPNTYGPVHAGQIAAMADGSVIFSLNLLYRYDPTTGTSSPLAEGIPGGAFMRTADGTRLIFAGGVRIGAYDLASNSVSGSGTLPTSQYPGVLTITGDASRILAGGRFLLDGSFNLLDDLSTDMSQPYRPVLSQFCAAAFSGDYSKLYLTASFYTGTNPSLLNPAMGVYSLNGGIRLAGYIPTGDINTDVNSQDTSIQITAAGNTVIPGNDGAYLINVTSPLPTLGIDTSLRIAPDSGLAANPAQTTITYGQGLDPVSVYFGALKGTNIKLAPGQQAFVTTIDITPPPTAASGPVDVAAVQSSGWASFAPWGYTFGLFLMDQDITAGPAEGGTTIGLYGYGIANSPYTTTVTVGGRPATLTGKDCGVSPGPPCLQIVTPPGDPGAADITVTNEFGSVTKQGGFQYLQHRIAGGIAPFQMLVDDSRGLLYAADFRGSLMAVDMNTLNTTRLLDLPATPVVSITLTPDRSRLVGASEAGIIVLNLQTGLVENIFNPIAPDLMSRYIPLTIAATARGSVLVGYDDLLLSDNGRLLEVDLSTGAAFDFPFLASQQTLFAPVPDGSGVLLANYGALSLWNAALDSITRSTPDVYPGQIATDASGGLFARDDFSLDRELGEAGGLYLDNQSTSSEVRDLAPGQKVHAGGGLRYVLTTKGVEIYEVASGRLLQSVGLSVLPTTDGLAIDHTGQFLFVAESQGIGVTQLSSIPLSIGHVTPPVASAIKPGQGVTITGSGFAQGATVTIGGKTSSAKLTDSTTLNFEPPVLPSGKYALTVTNPNGDSVTPLMPWDATTNLSGPAVIVTSARISVNLSQVTVTGSNFTARSRVAFNGTILGTLFVDSSTLVASIVTPRNITPLTLTVIDAVTGVVSNPLTLDGTGLIQATFNASPTQVAFAYQSGGSIPAPVTITLSGSVPLPSWTVTAAPQWLSVTQNNPQNNPQDNNGTFTLSANPAGLGVGVYQGQVAISGFAITPINVTLTVISSDAPLIHSVGNAFGEVPLISANTWTVIRGTNLAPPGDARTWTTADFGPSGNALPRQLDNVSITVNGLPAYVYYISPTQINILTPPELILGSVLVQVTNNGVVSNPFTVQAAGASPSLFYYLDGATVEILARHSDGTLVGSPATSAGALPAKPGEVIAIAATGLGPTSGMLFPGSITQSGILPELPAVTIGGVPAQVSFGGLISPGTFQINIAVPNSLGGGLSAIQAQYSGAATQTGLSLLVQP